MRLHGNGTVITKRPGLRRSVHFRYTPIRLLTFFSRIEKREFHKTTIFSIRLVGKTGIVYIGSRYMMTV